LIEKEISMFILEIKYKKAIIVKSPFWVMQCNFIQLFEI